MKKTIGGSADNAEHTRPGKRKGAGHGSGLSRDQEEAILALLSERNVEEAARLAGVGPATLYRWLKDPVFTRACEEAADAVLLQATGRLQQISGAAVSVLRKIMANPASPRPARLRAAAVVLRYRKSARELEKFWARLAEVNRAEERSKREPKATEKQAAPKQQPDGKARSGARRRGHGAKTHLRRTQVIAALLTQRSIEEAARVSGIGATTLFRWLKDPEFDDAWREARLTAFGRASARLRQSTELAVTTLQMIAGDPGTPPGMQVQAVDLILQYAVESSREDIEACVANSTRRAQQAQLPVLTGERGRFGETGRDPPGIAA